MGKNAFKHQHRTGILEFPFNMQYQITLRRQNARVGNLRLHCSGGLCMMSSGYQASKRGVHDLTSCREKITGTAPFLLGSEPF
jgi:hypothetical protein